jgi:signal transduction histidine kinase
MTGVEGTREEEVQHPPRHSKRSRLALEAEILSLTARLEAVERERPRLEEFAALAAHEVLKPLILSETYAGAVLDRAGDRLDLDSRAELETMASASSQARRLVEALLADAQQSGRPMLRAPVQLSRVVADCLQTLAPEIRARRARVDVGPLPVVPGNAVLLGAVFTNLLSNALEHGSMPECAIRISCTALQDEWMFEVDSAGPPIPEEDRDRIFEPLRRGSVGPQPRGVGLGLTLVHRIVQRHRGKVGVTSPDAWSNRFYFTLPM